MNWNASLSLKIWKKKKKEKKKKEKKKVLF